MEEDKKKKLEDQLRMLIAEANREKQKEPTIIRKSGNIRVIRRRKGQPDLEIA